jgi:hypothetical protein
MRRVNQRIRPTCLGLITLAAGLALTVPARAQTPSIPNMDQRSGLLNRVAPIMRTNLPQDPNRDTFYGTYYGDRAVRPGSNSMFNNGLYGQRLDPGCVSCRSPYFRGAPGRQGPICPDCIPTHKTHLGRVATSLVHPFKPVGHYYQNGCYVPLYDLDPLVPGPGPDFWPFYFNGHRGG